MAQEVNLNSLQEVEREEILQVLYRDQAVQNIEEERIRYVAIKWVEFFGFLASSARHLLLLGVLLLVYLLLLALLLSFLSDKSPREGLEMTVAV